MKAQEFAYAELELTPWQFWRLTPGELILMFRGWQRRDRQQRRQAAEWVCFIVNHIPFRGSGKSKPKAYKPEDLIGYSPEQMEELRRRGPASRMPRS